MLLICVGDEDNTDSGAMSVGDCMIRSESGPMVLVSNKDQLQEPQPSRSVLPSLSFGV